MQPKRAVTHTQVTQPIRIRPVPPAEQPAPIRTQPYPQPKSGLAQNGQRVSHSYPVPQRQRSIPLPPALRPVASPANLPQRSWQTKGGASRLWVWAGMGILALFAMSCAALTLGIGLIYAGGVLPGVYAGGAALGGLSQAQAAEKLSQEWQTIRVQDGQRAWEINPATFGITLDAEATAKAVYEAGRSDLSASLPGIVGRVDIAPNVQIDLATAEAGLRQMIAQFEQAPVNAGIRLVNGQVEATPPMSGRALDVRATLAEFQRNAGAVLADGILELVMVGVEPSVTDSTPMLEQATRLLSSSLDIRVYDPLTGDSVYWSVMPEEWGNWLVATTDSIGLNLTATDQPVRDYLRNKAETILDESRYLNLDEAVGNVQETIARGETRPYARVYHRDRQHIVQAGETIISIAWDYGIPYPYIQEANGGISSVSTGQAITIPSPDHFMPYPVVPDKRIVVSISQQRTMVYENGALKWDWPTSTGIDDSPTWPGIYQIISHEPLAYAGNWDLWMPNFLGVYRPIPGSEFTNGFHGFPTRGGSQLLWTNSLGTRVTYGCILLSNENEQALYNWAEEGVVVEIRP